MRIRSRLIAGVAAGVAALAGCSSAPTATDGQPISTTDPSLAGTAASVPTDAEASSSLSVLVDAVNQLGRRTVVASSTGPTTTASANASKTSATPQPPAEGVYTGIGEQRTTAGASLNTSFTVELTFVTDAALVRYPTRNCAGSLNAKGHSGTAVKFEENIIIGSCDTGGTWEITTAGDRNLHAVYKPLSGKYLVVAEMTR